MILHEEQDDVYRGMVRKLNREQKEFFYHVLHLVKTSDDPFYCFLSGGAGVGKSHLTKCLYQAALKYYNTRAGGDFHQVKILMLVPTGKAAYNIKGNTIHSALAVPACQSLKNYKHLDSRRLNTIRCELGGLRLIFLEDEIYYRGWNQLIPVTKLTLEAVDRKILDNHDTCLYAVEPLADEELYINLRNTKSRTKCCKDD